jgi:hypothetical protein
MAKLKLEASWGEEFKRASEAQSREPSNRGHIEDTKGQVGVRWRGDKAEAQRLVDEQTHHYFQWTAVAGVAAVIVSLIVFGLTFLH